MGMYFTCVLVVPDLLEVSESTLEVGHTLVVILEHDYATQTK
jgi:hypothetical protein